MVFQTLKEAKRGIDVLLEHGEDKFWEEIRKEAEEMNLEEAVSIALNYAKDHGYQFVRLIEVFPPKKDKQSWKILLDAGIIKRDVKSVELDIKGNIIGFDTEEA